MGLYKYTRLSPSLPPIPILQVQLFQPGVSRTTALACSAILDTGSDCTLIPLPLLQRVKAPIIGRSIQIPVGGVAAPAIPYVAGISFDKYRLSALKVFGCSENDIGDTLLIGRDLMNRYRIEFNGPALEFEIF